MIEYSIVIPVFNSEQSLDELITRIHDVMQAHFTFEVICVNDYSSDGSWSKLTELKKRFNDTLKIISLSRNFGQHSAIFCGFTYAQGDFILPKNVPRCPPASRP